MIRTGLGIDTHAFAAGRPLILGGVDIPHEEGLAGHSDADVLTHAVIDALLGAAGLGDIGQHFPDTDPRFKDADSIELLRTVVTYLGERGFAIGSPASTAISSSAGAGYSSPAGLRRPAVDISIATPASSIASTAGS